MIQLTQPLHHAYGVSGNADMLVHQILRALEESVGFAAKGNPDFRAERHEVLGIDEARALKEAAERTAVTGGKKVFIVSARGITHQAQNALLKIFEEPPLGTHFFLIVPSLELLLPTLRSRMTLLRASDSRHENQMLEALEEEKKEKEDSTEALVEKGKIFAFLDDIERKLGEDSVKNSAALSELLEVKKYSRDRAPSLKLLLEHLALVLPRK